MNRASVRVPVTLNIRAPSREGETLTGNLTGDTLAGNIPAGLYGFRLTLTETYISARARPSLTSPL